MLPPQRHLHGPSSQPCRLIERQERYCRQERAVQRVQAEPRSKGFGAPPAAPKKPPTKKDKQKTVGIAENGAAAVRKAVDLADAGKARPISDKEAARGRIDYAKVKDWGMGRPQDIGNLEVQSFQPGTKQVQQKDMAFYVQLTWAIVQEQGLIDDYLKNRLPVPARQPLPDASQWSLSRERYVQYLVNQQAVHHALESGVAEALAVNQEVAELAGVRAALACFSESRGLGRSLEIAADLTNIDATGPHNGAEQPVPSPEVASYVEYLGRIASDCAEAADLLKRGAAILKLIAHVYCNHLQLFTIGSKTGAEVAKKLDLFKRHAVNFYRTYPYEDPMVGKNPLEAFQRNVNEAGTLLSEEDKEEVMSELPCAMAHTIQLMEALAHED